MWNNRVILTGYLTRGIEKKIAADKSVCSFTVAVQKMMKDDEADFINCVAWGQQADYLSQYGKKGTRVSLEGRIQTRSYQKDDSTVYVTEVVVDNCHLYKPNSTNE